jgi:hypothetical protein
MSATKSPEAKMKPAAPASAPGPHGTISTGRTALEDWNIARAIIEHENELTNHRMQWLLTAQGFLFGAFALVITEAIKHPANDPAMHLAWVTLWAISLLGAVISVFVGISLLTSKMQHDAAGKWFRDCHGKLIEERNLPPIFGKSQIANLLGLSFLPWIVLICWVAILVALPPLASASHPTTIPQLPLTSATTPTTPGTAPHP